MVLTADELERVGDPVHVGDAGQGAQVEAVEGVDVADQADDGAGHAGGYERLSADGADLVHDMGDVLVGRVRAHDDDHGRAFLRVGSPERTGGQRPARLETGGWTAAPG